MKFSYIGRMKLMNEQTIILCFLFVATGITLFLYVWKAKKQVEYENDERWQLIQNKANEATNYLNYILILLLAAGEMISLFSDIQITFTLNRILTYGILFIGFHNMIELFGLSYFDKKI